MQSESWYSKYAVWKPIFKICSLKADIQNMQSKSWYSKYAVWKLIFKTITFWTESTVLTIHDHGEPNLWIHRLKDNPNGDKSPFTFHSYLGITRWLVATGKRGKLVGWVLFSSGGLEDSFCSGVLLRAALGDNSLLSLSLSLWLTGGPGMYFC